MASPYLATVGKYERIAKAVAEDELTRIVMELPSNESLNDLKERFDVLSRKNPHLDLLYVLKLDGTLDHLMVAANSGRKALIDEHVHDGGNHGHLTHRHRPHFNPDSTSDTPKVCRPYLSSATKAACVSVSRRINLDGHERILVIDADVGSLTEELAGEEWLRRLDYFAKVFYGLISAALLLTALTILCGGIYELVTSLYKTVHLLWNTPPSPTMKVDEIRNYLHIMILFTVSLAIFDLVKTLVEEEILLYKDIDEPSPGRRTVIRFTTTILVALSIETLVQVFVASHASQAQTASRLQPIAMMYGLASILAGLALYIMLTAITDKISQTEKS